MTISFKHSVASIFVMIMILSLSCPAYAIKIREQTSMEFGTILAPISGSGTITVDVNNNVSGSISVISGSPSRAEFEVTDNKKNAGDSMNIDIQSTGNVPGLSFTMFTAEYDGSMISIPTAGIPSPGNIKTNLVVGATLTVSSSVASGDLSPEFDININYD